MDRLAAGVVFAALLVLSESVDAHWSGRLNDAWVSPVDAADKVPSQELVEQPERSTQENQELVDTQVRARAQDKARAQYEAAMSHMQAMSDKLVAMEKDYNKRAGFAGIEEDEAAEQERKEIQDAAKEFPFLGLQTSLDSLDHANMKDGKHVKDEIVDALKHHEVDELEDAVEQEHIQMRNDPDPMASLKLIKHQQEEKRSKDTALTMRWTALQDGWDVNDLPKPDEGKVEMEASRIEEAIEQKGTHLSKGQRDAILEATRVHEEGNIKLDMEKRRLDAMNQLVEDQDKEHKKERMLAQAEQMFSEKDSMDAELEAVEAEGYQAVQSQKHATELMGREGLVQEFEDDEH